MTISYSKNDPSAWTTLLPKTYNWQRYKSSKWCEIKKREIIPNLTLNLLHALVNSNQLFLYISMHPTLFIQWTNFFKPRTGILSVNSLCHTVHCRTWKLRRVRGSIYINFHYLITQSPKITPMFGDFYRYFSKKKI